MALGVLTCFRQVTELSFVTLSILMTTGKEVGVEGHTNDCDSDLGYHTLSTSLLLQGPVFMVFPTCLLPCKHVCPD